MKQIEFYKSVFAILRIDTSLAQNNAKVAGTGFIINTDPLYVLTCNHVVSEGNEDNNDRIVFGVARRTDDIKEFDLRNFQITYIKAKRIFYKPEYDFAVLEIDYSESPNEAEKLGIPKNIKPLKLDFNEVRDVGSSVEWVSAGTLGDISITPRFFNGNVVAKYTRDQAYKFVNNQGAEQQQIMQGIKFLEVNQLFLPGCSGGPIILSKNKKVIGWVHGFNSWPIATDNTIGYKAEIIENNISKNVDVKTKSILTASLSLAVDIKSVEKIIVDNNFIKKNKFIFF